MAKSILEIFHKYQPKEDDRKLLESGTVQRVRIQREQKIVELEVSFPALVEKKTLYRIEREMSEAHGLSSVRLLPRYDASLFSQEYLPEILKETERCGIVSRGFFDRYQISVGGDSIQISIFFSDGGVELLCNAKTDELISDFIYHEFGLRFHVTLDRHADYHPNSEEEEQRKRKALLDIYREEQAAAVAEASNTEKPIPTLAKTNAIDGHTEAEVTNIGDTMIRIGNMTFDIEEAAALYGHDFPINPTPIAMLLREQRGVVALGLIFGIESKELRRGDKMSITFSLTDNSASVTVKTICEIERARTLLGVIAEGKVVAVRGNMRSDNYDNELYLSLSDVMAVKEIKRADTASEKRVELHIHTQMSSMDAIIPPSDVVKTAKAWGMPAVAITDHGNVQGFQDAMLASEKIGQKVIYGIEAYFVNDTARAVYGEADCAFTDRFCVFDIETTGLSPLSCHITEIGAVRYEGGKITEVFNTMVDPGEHIPEKITALTGIDDTMVAGAPKPLEAVQAFLQFAGNDILVAHNATFDVSFISKVCEENSIPFDNTFLDTVALSRYVNPELTKHKLDNLAEYFSLGDFNHHRASDDAEMLALIFGKMAEKLIEEGVRTISEMKRAMSDKVDPLRLRPYHMIILAANKVGLKNMYKLISHSYLDYYRKVPRIPKSVLDTHREGLIIGSACSEGELYNALLSNKPHSELVSIAGYYDYLEIQPICNDAYLIENGTVPNEEALRELNRRIIALGGELNKPVCATCDAHFLNREDEIYRKVLISFKYSDGDRDTGIFFRTTEEMLSEFAYLGEEKAHEVVVTNTNLIASRIADDIRPFPKGTFTPHMDGAEEDLQRICYEHAKSMYGDPLPEIVAKRLDKELTSIISHGFAVLYMIAQKLVWYSESQGYLVGSRGSVGSSFVASMAGISEVNPLPPHYWCPKCQYYDFSNEQGAGSGFDLPDKNCPRCGTKLHNDGHDIPFETFLGFYGDKSPDIDLNFSGEVQGKVHKYTEELFGAENVFRAGTIGTLADKTAYGYVAKYLEEHGRAVNRAEMNRMVQHCVGVRRTTGQHPGGIVVVPREYEIYDFCPVQHPAEKESSDIVTTHFTFEYLHDTLLKLDELGHDMPTKYKWMERYSGVKIEDIPMNDPAVYELFLSTKPLGIVPGDIGCNIGTYGLPEFGTRFVQKMLEEAKPKSFADLLQISGLSHGTDVWTGNAQDLINQGICSISEVVGTRDSIMLTLIRYGVDNAMSFKIMESVRKGRGLTPEWEEAMRAHEVPDWYIDSCKKIKYMFPKAHAAAYVMSAIRLGWYKIYQPIAFYAGFFTVAPKGIEAQVVMSGKTGVACKIEEIEKNDDATAKDNEMLSALQLVNECYARGFRFLPVDLQKSHTFAFLPEDGKIRLPFSSLAGVGDTAAAAITAAREQSEILSVEDLRHRAKLSSAVITILEENGVLRGLSQTNQLTFF